LPNLGCGPETGENRVNRGGSWNNTASPQDAAQNSRAANRNRNRPANRNNNLGLRLALPVAHRRGRRAFAEPGRIPSLAALCGRGEEERRPGAGTASGCGGKVPVRRLIGRLSLLLATT
jgi:hypothetical protein